MYSKHILDNNHINPVRDLQRNPAEFLPENNVSQSVLRRCNICIYKHIPHSILRTETLILEGEENK